MGTLAALAGCASTPTPTANAVAAAPQVPVPPSLQELMQQAQSALQAGQRERARQSWREAARVYPTQKAPWQKLAEDYFDGADYGNAILAAQEVLQRDAQDTLAHSVLAVSGLRLSTVSLLALRERSSYPVGSRDEALGLTRAMRDALGEATLVPARSDGAVAVKPAAAAQAAPGAANKAAHKAVHKAANAAAARAPGAANATNAANAAAGPPTPVVPVATQVPTGKPATPAVAAKTPPAATTATTAKPNDPFKLLN